LIVCVFVCESAGLLSVCCLSAVCLPSVCRVVACLLCPVYPGIYRVCHLRPVFPSLAAASVTFGGSSGKPAVQVSITGQAGPWSVIVYLFHESG
jgi:hypothetical protein